MVVIIPESLSTEKRPLMLWIEMKRRKGGVVSEFQKKWISDINKIKDQEAKVCLGSEEAIAFISQYLL